MSAELTHSCMCLSQDCECELCIQQYRTGLLALSCSVATALYLDLPNLLVLAESFVRISKQQKQHTTDREVAVALTNTSFSSRKLNATVQIDAPLEVVWSSLTDYDNLGTFIPSLVENRCLERRPQGCLLYQVRQFGFGLALHMLLPQVFKHVVLEDRHMSGFGMYVPLAQ